MSRALAALGAKVIKVERPKAGDAGRAHAIMLHGQSGYFLQQNMGKQGLCIDLKDKRGLKLMHKLVGTDDVFVENYRPGALDRLGLGYKQLSEINPRLVYCSVSAYGHTGPDSGQPGFGLIAEAKSGVMAQLGVPGKPPPLLRIPVADMYAGIYGVASVCAALVGRAASGRGQHIDMALYDGMISIHDYAVQRYTLNDDIPVQTGHDQPESTVYGTFTARDGYLVIAAQVDDAWMRLARLVGGDALAADTRFLDPVSRNANRKEALAYVQDWCTAQPSRAACIAALDGAQVPCAAVQTVNEVVADPQTIARGMMVEQDHPVLGRVRLPNLPFRFSGCDTSPRSAAPLMGQHNRQVAASLGCAPDEIEALLGDGVLYAEPAVADLPATGGVR